MLVEEKRIYTEQELYLLLDISNDLDLIRLISEKELLNKKSIDLELGDLIDRDFNKYMEELSTILFNRSFQDFRISDRVEKLLEEDGIFKELYDLNFKR